MFLNFINKTVSMKLTKQHKKIITYIALPLTVLAIILIIVQSIIKPDIAAKVNDEKISMEELEYFYNRVKSVNPEATKESVLNQLIVNKLLMEEAENKNIRVSEEEVDLILQDTEKVYNKNIDTLAQESGITKDELKEKVKEQLVVRRLLEGKTEFKTTDEELKKLYDENKEKFKLPRMVNVSHILLNTEEEALKVKSEIESGGDFYELARLESQDPSAKQNGGNIGPIQPGQTVKEFEEFVSTLESGEIGGPINTTFGYHIVKVEGISDERNLPFSEIKDKLKEYVEEQKKQEAYSNFVRELTNKAKIEKYI